MENSHRRDALLLLCPGVLQRPEQKIEFKMNKAFIIRLCKHLKGKGESELLQHYYFFVMLKIKSESKHFPFGEGITNLFGSFSLKKGLNSDINFRSTNLLKIFIP